jgi:hypothetical protein
MVLEEIRSKYFPHKPSRLRSRFACESLETIQYYRSHHSQNRFIYRVEIVNEKAALHKGDFNAVEPTPGNPTNMYEIALMYWQYKLKSIVREWPHIECSEIVVASQLCAIDILD